MQTRVLLIFAILCGAGRAGDDFIWWEAETAKESNFPRESSFSPKSLDAGGLSGGDWLHADGARNGAALFARYELNVPADGEYDFWARKFWHHGPFRYRVDDGGWTSVEKAALVDNTSLRKFVCANWILCGKVKLSAGRHTISLETLDAKSPACFDCFLLTRKPFFPRGVLKPGEKSNRKEEGWFAFEPDDDAFSPEALLDLRGMNHRQCGELGHLKTNGPDFVWEKDPAKTPVKFWGTCIGNFSNYPRPIIDHFARRTAKLGINMVRMHGAFHGGVPGNPLEVSDQTVDNFNYLVSALKREGVYLMLNAYYDLFFSVTPEMNLPGYAAGQHTNHFLFIHPRGQEIWNNWVRRLLSAQNPYTGMVNAHDPTIAVVQIVNEDNYFWHSFRPYKNIPEPVINVLEKRYGEWLEKKYGSLEKARQAWGPASPAVKGDAFEAGRAGLFPVSTLTEGGRKERERAPQRYSDQAEFLTQDLRTVFGTMQDYLKKSLDYKGLVNGGNWMCADSRVLEPLDMYANTACDVMDRHGVGFYSRSEMQRGFEILPGDKYEDRSPLFDPEKTAIMDMQCEGKVHVLSEPKSANPNRYRAEWLPLMAGYGLLQGTDAVAHFSGSIGWTSSHGRFSIDCPTMIGQCPATALIFRNRYVKEGPVVIDEGLKLSQLYHFKPSPLNAARIGETLDAKVPEGDITLGEAARDGRFAYFVGMVRRRVGENPPESKADDLSRYIDRQNKIVRSATGELAWNWKSGLFTINAPCAQGAAGFLADGGSIKLTDITIESRNHYGSIFVVSMDGKPLSQSRKVLLQAASEDRNFGWRTKPATFAKSPEPANEIVSLGGAPVMVKNFEGSVTLNLSNSTTFKVFALDPLGYKKSQLQDAKSGEVRLQLLPDVIYYIIERE